jgi:hypothetical protein
MSQLHTNTWAAFCARLQWPTTYHRGRLVVHGGSPLLLVPTRAMRHIQFQAAAADAEMDAIRLGWADDILVVGTHPLPAVRSYLRGDPAAGLLGEYDAEAEDYHWDAGLWLRCDTCGRLGVYHEMRSWHLRPCGHYAQPQDRHLRSTHVPAIGRAWAEACYSTQHSRRTR